MVKTGADIVPTAQAAEELQISKLTLYYLMESGLINVGFVRPSSKGHRRYATVYRKLLDKEKERILTEGGIV